MESKPTEETKKEANSTPKKWTEIAEVRMVLYVVPVGIAVALLSLILSRCSQ
jgi:hypothetical protein